MSSTSTVGGAVGEIRAAIDEARFSDYIAVNVPEIVVPVEIRQFQYGQVSLAGGVFPQNEDCCPSRILRTF